MKLATAVVAFAIATTLAVPLRAGEPQTMVILNGKATPVFFNDGDSFRVLSGPRKGSKARIAGFNTLESHGAVHSWGKWTVKEMYVLAKMATLTARRGKWSCKTDGKTDTYGRMLTYCPALGETLIRMGLAHALSVSDEPADPTYLAAQREAIKAKRGIWAHGVPPFVLTSLHSVEEDTEGHGTYNRLVSVADGHSVKWKHENRYAECENVCHIIYSFDDSKIGPLVAFLKDDSEVADRLSKLSDKDLAMVVRDFARYRHVARAVPEDDREAVAAALTKLAEEGRFGTQSSKKGSCMVHVPFDRRFGGTRAECLR